MNDTFCVLSQLMHVCAGKKWMYMHRAEEIGQWQWKVMSAKLCFPSFWVPLVLFTSIFFLLRPQTKTLKHVFSETWNVCPCLFYLVNCRVPTCVSIRPCCWKFNYTYFRTSILLSKNRITTGFHGAFVTGVACQQGALTLPDTWFRPPFWTC